MSDLFEKIEKLNAKGHDQELRMGIYMQSKAIMENLKMANILMGIEQKEINGGTFQNAFEYVRKAKFLIDKLIDYEKGIIRRPTLGEYIREAPNSEFEAMGYSKEEIERMRQWE